jgi:hypothetical protein
MRTCGTCMLWSTWWTFREGRMRAWVPDMRALQMEPVFALS